MLDPRKSTVHCSTEWQLRGLPHAHALWHTLQNPKGNGDSDTTAKTDEMVPPTGSRKNNQCG
jgi:hypothetical protein